MAVVLEVAAGGVADGAEFEFKGDSGVPSEVEELSGTEDSLEEDALVTKEKMRQGHEHALKRERPRATSPVSVSLLSVM